MGRCVPSVCDEADVQAGWDNFFADIHLTWYKPYVINCHTEEEKSTHYIVKMWKKFKIPLQFLWILLTMVWLEF